MKSKLFVFFIATLFLIVLVGLASAATTNVTKVTQNDSIICLNESTAIMNEIQSEGYNIIRVNDSLKQAQALYDSQVVLMGKKRNYDFAIVIPYCDAIKKMKEDWITAKDEYSALLQFYNDSITPGMNTESIDVMMNSVKDEITNERYENVKALADKTYAEIISVQSSNTALTIFLSSTATGFKSFFVNNWKWLLTILVLAVVGFLAYRIKILKWMTQRKMNNLELRKSTLKGLIMKTQKDYFQTGKISEGEYNIKTKKFAELVRDIDRQIPLLREELIKLERKSKHQEIVKVKKSEKVDNSDRFFGSVIRRIHLDHSDVKKKSIRRKARKTNRRAKKTVKVKKKIRKIQKKLKVKIKARIKAKKQKRISRKKKI